MECYYKGMKIKFSNEVRDALRKFSKVDRSEYIERSVAKQLAKDGRIAFPNDPEQKESEPVSESPRVTTWGPVEGTVPFSYSCSSGSGSGFVGVGFAAGGGSRFTSGSPVSDSGYVFGSGTGGNASQSN